MSLPVIDRGAPSKFVGSDNQLERFPAGKGDSTAPRGGEASGSPKLCKPLD